MVQPRRSRAFGAEGAETRVNAFLTLRPAPSVRVEGSAVWARIERERDGSEFAETVIPRLKLEYQPTRALFFRDRSVAEGAARHAARCADWLAAVRERQPRRGHRSRTAACGLVDLVRADAGTVAFFGYGSSMEPPLGSRLSDARRVADGFFVKLAYQFRR